MPSAIKIANEADVAKGTLYIYFRTKEAIFLGVLERQLQNWIADFDSKLRQYDKVTCEDIVSYLLAYWQQNPITGDLARLLDSTLECNVEEKVSTGFHTKIVNDYKRIIPSLSAINSDVEASQWLSLLTLSHQLLTLAWSQSHPHYHQPGQAVIEFDRAAAKLLTPFWRELMDYKKEQPKAKSGWRKFLGS